MSDYLMERTPEIEQTVEMEKEPAQMVENAVKPLEMKKAPVEYVLTNESDVNLPDSKVEMMSSKIGYLVGVDDSRFTMKQDANSPDLFAVETNHKLDPEIFKKVIGSQVNIMLNNTGDKIQVDAWEGRGSSLGRVFSVEQRIGKSIESNPVEIVPDARAIKTLQDRYTGLKEALVRTNDAEKGEIVLNGQEYVAKSIQQGFTETFARQEGSSTTAYGFLRKETSTHRTVKDNRIGQFVKSVREVDLDGKILPALEKAGITLTKEKTLQEKVAERMKAKGFSL